MVEAALSDFLHNAQDDLYHQTVENGWYEKDPRPTSVGCARRPRLDRADRLVPPRFANQLSIWTILSALILVAGGVFLTKRLKRRVPTAVGTCDHDPGARLQEVPGHR